MAKRMRAVLFDADGVLVDACELHYRALNAALAEYGFEIAREEHLAEFNGLPTRTKLQMLTERRGLDPALHDAINRRKQALTAEFIDEAISPDVDKRRLLLRLRENGCRIAVCSNAIASSVERMLDAIGVRDLVDATLGNDQVVRPKPAPDIYLHGAAMLGLSIGSCVIVEDSPVGIRSAEAARPLDIVVVSGPHEVGMALWPRFEAHLHSLMEAA